MNDETKYIAPKGLDGKPYWVPVVVKSKDYLVGFIDSISVVKQIVDNVEFDALLSTLASDRFNDVLPSGVRISDMNDVQFKEHIKQLILKDQEKIILRDKNKEFSNDILDDYFHAISCTCGNFIGFKTPFDIPENDMDCDLCGKRLLEYTHKDDDEFIYDGSQRDMESVVVDIMNELNEGNE